MITRRRRRTHLAALLAVLAVPATLALQAEPARAQRSGPAAPRPDVTSAVEARRVDRVPTPKLAWYPCYRGDGECATAWLPRDYDEPKGAQVKVALLRVRARDPKNRIGTLFLNPGGPGGQGTLMALGASDWLGRDVLNRFDLVGFDPRGLGSSERVACFRNESQQVAGLAGLAVPFPYTKAEEQRYITSSRGFGRACSTVGRPMAGSMSTAEVARDLDVLRRAVGDRKLTFLGFSYGTYLAQVYAALFPDRVRALVLDGVLDPVAWAGTTATAGRPQTLRFGSAESASRALREVLVRCDKAGVRRCKAAAGDPVKRYDLAAERLKKKPVRVVTDPDEGPVTITYASFVRDTMSALYGASDAATIPDMVENVLKLTEPARTAARERAAATVRLGRQLAALHSRREQGRFGFPYDNSPDAFQSVLCTDGLNPRDASAWPGYAAAAERSAKHFGRLTAWTSAPCASRTWTVQDEDAYRGPFTKRTAAPVLVVGSRWDPATPYSGAVKAASLLPASRLLSSDNWGHTAYGSSACVNRAVHAYLLRGTLPARGARCVGDVQPFRSAPPSTRASALAPRAADRQPSPSPVVRPLVDPR